jgi:GT2 family glycosyltransferase
MSASGQLHDAAAPLASSARQPRDDESRPDISVVIPARNEAHQLSRQLEALAAQQWPGCWEVVVADNGSTDGTRAVALGYAGRLPSLRVVDAASRPGRHHACNAGAGAAFGRSIVFVDADDVVAPDYLAAMAAALTCHDVVAARLDHAALDAEWMEGVGSAIQTDALQPGFGFLPYGAGCSLGFRHDVFDAVGGFREQATYCEDVDICWRAQLAGYHIEFVPGAIVHYQSRPTLRAMYRQHRQYAAAQAFLFHSYRSFGMPRRTFGQTLTEWFAVVKAVPRLRSRTEVARWTRRVGRCVGRLQGSARYRVWYP